MATIDKSNDIKIGGTLSTAAMSNKLAHADEIYDESWNGDEGLDQSSINAELLGYITDNKSGLSDLKDAINANTELINANTELINANTGLIINAHASVSITASQTIIERGVNVNVTFYGTASFNGSADLVSEMDIYASSSTSGTPVATSTMSPIHYTALLSNEVKYSVKAIIGGVTKTATCSVSAYYPVYIIASADMPTADTITSGAKRSISSTAAGTYTITTEQDDYVWLCVPLGVTVPTSATMSGFDCPIENVTTVSGVSVNGDSVAYTLIKTVNAMKADTLTITYS